MELIGLSQAVVDMFLRFPYLYVPKSIGDPTSGFHEFPFELVDAPALSDIDTTRKIYISRGRFQVVAVPFRLEEATQTIEDIQSGQVTTNDDDTTTL